LRISAIIPTKNRTEDLIMTIGSLITQTQLPFECIVVDDSLDENYQKNEQTMESMLSGRSIAWHHFRSDGKGINAARNAGASRASGDVFLFLDDDIELDPLYVEAILRVFEKPEKPGGVGGVIKNSTPPNPMEAAFKRLFLLSRSASGRGYLMRSGFPCHLERCNEVTRVEVLSGSNMSYRAEIFDYFEFDERMTGYSYLDDVDFSYRVSIKYPLYITPEAKLVHHTKPKTVSGEFHRVKVIYHLLLFNKIENRTLLDDISFGISILGGLIQSIGASFLNRNSAPIRGFLKGIDDMGAIRSV
jgi:GT2 family glycosyltransferase